MKFNRRMSRVDIKPETRTVNASDESRKFFLERLNNIKGIEGRPANAPIDMDVGTETFIHHYMSFYLNSNQGLKGELK
jgi:hypothetical protein